MRIKPYLLHASPAASMGRVILLAGLLVGLALAAMPAQAQQVKALDALFDDQNRQSYVATYVASIRGFEIANIDVYFDVNDKHYHLRASARTTGIGRLFSSDRGETLSYGSLKDNGFIPEGVSIAWTAGETIKGARIGYSQGAPSSFYSDYPLPSERIPETPVNIDEVGPGTVDPFLTMLEMIGPQGLDLVCSQPKRMFDGRRLSVLSPRAREEQSAESHDFAPEIPVVACQSRWQPIAGYSNESLERAEEFGLIDSYFMAIGDTGFAAPVQITGATRYGRFKVESEQFFQPLGAKK